MVEFQNKEVAEQTRRELGHLTHLELGAAFDELFALSADPDLALLNLRRWLAATSNPGTYLAHLVSLPRLGQFILMLLGASQSVADALIQNPELAPMVMDPDELGRAVTTHIILDGGRELLASTHSYAHRLDRLRYLRQRWKMLIVVNDLSGAMEQPKVWEALSDLADAILIQTRQVVWEEYAGRQGLAIESPVSVVSFGKLAGRELNYSSDVDLVYVLEDDCSEDLERHATRYSEMLTRALADPMGRGNLYRVDLRLRPFGGAGPVAPTMKSVEAYYRSHAEGWEIQALMRSRLVAGSPPVLTRWTKLVDETCFRKSVSELTVADLVDNRERIERHSDPEDLKRGRGGIRDIEFLVQVLQMLHGFEDPELRLPNTLHLLDVLYRRGFFDQESFLAAQDGYTFLRKLEHRCQLVNDQQTHSLPASESGRRHVARLMGYRDWESLSEDLDKHRKQIREVYSQIHSVSENPVTTDKESVLRRVPQSLSQPLEQWIEALPEKDQFYHSLIENTGSLGRVELLLANAPTLTPFLSRSVSVTESIISGEIEESADPAAQLKAAGTGALGKAAVNAWARVAAQWVLDPSEPMRANLCHLIDEAVLKLVSETKTDLDVIGLGSYGTLEMGLSSDFDLLLLVKDDRSQPKGEAAGQKLLAGLEQLKRDGWPFSTDLRLRPQGGKGLLVRSYSGLRFYELEEMESWERFALGQARLVAGSEDALEVVRRAAYAEPLTPEMLKELIAMKHRIETERVQPQYWKRNVKLGFGGLSDIEWFTHLHEMRYPTATEAGKQVSYGDRLHRVAEATLINTLELEALLTAREHLLNVRDRLFLLGLTVDVIPENPDKLDKLAQVSGHGSGNAFLRHHEGLIEAVRTIYLEGLERLGI